MGYSHNWLHFLRTSNADFRYPQGTADVGPFLSTTVIKKNGGITQKFADYKENQ